MSNLYPLSSFIKRRLSRSNRMVLFVFLIGLLILLIWTIYIYLPGGYDWEITFRPAAIELLNGRSPYSVSQFYNPVWILIPLLPLALLPAKIGTTVLFVSGLFAYAYIAYKLEAKPLTLFIFLISSPTLSGLYNGQIEWLVTLGLVMPQPVGLFFLLSKPQTGIGIAIFWFMEAFREGGWRDVARKFAPVCIAFMLSFLFYGMWGLKAIGRIESGFNASLWPYSLPIGLFLLAKGLRDRSLRPAMISSPFMAPYLTPHSWSIVLLGLIRERTLLIIVVIISWIAEIWIW